MYSKDLPLIEDKIKKELEKGKKVTLLAPHESIFYKVEEHIGLVMNIEDYKRGEMTTLKIKFADNVTADVRAYIDSTIQSNTFVSLYGIYIQTEEGPKYYAKGGMMRIITKATDLPTFNFLKVYRMGIVTELSKLELSPVYQNNSNVFPLGNTKLFFGVEDINATANEANTQYAEEVSTTGMLKVFQTSQFTKNMQEEQENDGPEKIELCGRLFNQIK